MKFPNNRDSHEMNLEGSSTPAPSSTSSSTAAVRPSKTTRGVLCGKCEHLNDADARECRYCGESLFSKCRHCGHVNQRVLSTCTRCRRPIQGRHKRRRRAGNSRALTLFEKILLIGGSVLFLVAATWYTAVR